MTAEAPRLPIPQTAGEAELRFGTSYYHYLGLPIGAPPNQALARSQAFRTYMQTNWMTKRDLEKIVQRHLKDIEATFSDASRAETYRHQILDKAALLQRDALQFARKHHFYSREDANNFPEAFALIRDKIPAIVARAGRERSNRVEPVTPPPKPVPQPRRSRPPPPQQRTVWNSTSQQIIDDILMPWLRRLARTTFAWAGRERKRLAGVLAATVSIAFVWHLATSQGTHGSRAYRVQRPYPAHTATAASVPQAVNRVPQRVASPPTSFVRRPPHASRPRHIHLVQQPHAVPHVVARAHVPHPVPHTKARTTVNDLAREIDP